MDYYSMKRIELQALCKEHNIPANSTNSVMADKLSQLLNEKQKPTTRRACLKTPVETHGEGEPAVSKREAKKVRFSPNSDLVEYELRSGKKQKDVVAETRGRRKSMADTVDKQVIIDNYNTAELNNDSAQIPVKLTRSRGQVSGKDVVIPNNKMKQGRRAAEYVGKVAEIVKDPEGNLGKVTKSKVHTLNKGAVQLDETKQSKREVKEVQKANESVEETVVGRVRVTRSKAQSLMDDGTGSDVNPHLKKSIGRQVAKDAESVKPSREITDIPVRVTRTRGQILKGDIENMVTNSQAEKKRTRKEMKSTDLSSTLSAQDDKQKLPKRKSLRTRGSETVDEDEAEKLGRGKQKKRSKESVAESQHHADSGLRQSRRNVAKVEDSKVLNKNVSKVEVVNDKKATRSKHKKESKLVQKLEEPSDHGEKKVVNRRKSVMQKANGKGIDKPLVGKRESIEATVMVVSPTRETRKTVGKTQSKEQSESQSLTDEDLEDIEDVTRSGKDTENQMKAVVDATGSTKSRKRRGTPIVEDQPIDTQYVPPVDKSPKQFAPSSGKSEGKSVAKKHVESNSKASASRKNNKLAVENAFLELDVENSSKKRAKLSRTNERYSENHSEKSNIKQTAVCKLGIFKREEVTETESTPTNESHRRVTRSAIRTVGKEPSRPAIKGQSIADAQFSSRKGARFTPVLADTAPGRVTRSGIKHGRRAAIVFSEKVDKKKQLSQSALRKQPLDDTQMSSPEGAEVRLIPDVDTIGVQSEISKETTGHILEHLDDLSASESVKLPTIVFEENMVSMIGNAIVMENLIPVSAENASGVESVTMAEKPEIFETTPDTISEGSHVQNETQEVAVKSTFLSEAEVPLNLEKPVAHENEPDLKKLGSTSKVLQDDLMAEEPVISVDKTVVIEENAGILNKAGSPAVCHVSAEHLDVKGKSKDMEDQVELSIIENVNQFVEDDGSYSQIAKGSEQNDLTCKDWLQNDSVDKDEVADNGEHDDDDENASVQMPLMNEPVSEDKAVADGVDAQEIYASDNKELNDIIASGPSVNEHGVELSALKSVNCLAMDRSGVADDVSVAGNYPTKKIEFEAVPSTVYDVPEVPIFGESDNKEDRIIAGQTVAKHSELSTGNDGDVVDAGKAPTKKVEFEVVVPSTGNDGENGEDGLVATKESEIDSILSTDWNMIEDHVLSGTDGEDGSANAIDCDTDSPPSTDGNRLEDSVLRDNDGEDERAETNCQIDSLLSTDGNMITDSVLNGIDSEAESNPKLLTDHNVSDTSLYGKDDFNINRQLEPTLESSPADDLFEGSFSDNDINVPKELETGLEPSNVPVLINDVNIDFRNDRLTGNVSPAMDDHNVGGEVSEPAPNENKPVVTEVSIRSSDQEPEQVCHVAADEVPCDTVGICASVGPSDSSTSIEAPHTEVSIRSSDQEPEQVCHVAADEVPCDTFGICASVGPSDSSTSIEAPHTEVSIRSSDQEPEQVCNVAADEVPCDTVGICASVGPSDSSTSIEAPHTVVSIRSSDQEPEQVCHVAADEVPCDTVGICASVGPSDSSTCIEAPHTYAITVDPLEESVLDISKKAVSNILGDTYETDTENNSGNEQEFTEQVCHVAADEVPCDTVGICASVIPSDSATSIEAPHTYAITVDPLEESILDINKKAVSNDLGDTYETDTENNIGNEQKFTEQVCHVAADEVPCDTVGICASVGPSDSSTSIEAPHTYAITVDPVEESILDINKKAVSNILGDTYETDTENNNGNEQKFTELDEGVNPKESESFHPGMIKEQTSEKPEMETRNDHTSNYQEENTAATVDLDLDGGEFMEDCSNLGVDDLDSETGGLINANESPTREETSPIIQTKEEPTVDVDSSQLMGDVEAHENLITKRSLPITYTNEESPLDDSDSPTFIKEDDINKQEETITVRTAVVWGDYGFAIDEYHNPVTANESDEELDQNKKEFQPSVGASSSSEENSRVADDMLNSVKNVEMDSRNLANEKSNQEVDMLKENVNADMTEEGFNWPGSSLKSLFARPTTARISHVKNGEEDAGGSFTFSDDRCSKEIAKNRTETHDFDHQWQNEQLRIFDGETQGDATTHNSENVTYEFPNIEEYSRKFFEDEDDDPSAGLAKDTHFEFKGDHVDQTKHSDSSSQAEGTSGHLASGLQDNSTYNDELERTKNLK